MGRKVVERLTSTLAGAISDDTVENPLYRWIFLESSFDEMLKNRPVKN